jgi:hypothetical protein
LRISKKVLGPAAKFLVDPRGLKLGSAEDDVVGTEV